MENKKNLKRFFTFLSFYLTQTGVYVLLYVAKDHHQNTYCNTPKNEY